MSVDTGRRVLRRTLLTGTSRLTTEKLRREAKLWAASLFWVSSCCLKLPATIAIPSTSSKLTRMEPTREAETTSSRLCERATLVQSVLGVNQQKS
jgi:hypothetical protein